MNERIDGAIAAPDQRVHCNSGGRSVPEQGDQRIEHALEIEPAHHNGQVGHLLIVCIGKRIHET